MYLRRGDAMNIPAVTLALWSPRGLADAVANATELLARVRPTCVMLHDSPSQLQTHAPAAVAGVRKLLGQGQRVWLGVAADAGISDARMGTLGPDELLRRREGVAHLAADLGCDAVMWNAEAAWKQRVAGFNAVDADMLVESVHGLLPTLMQAHTAYDQPTLHGSYPWKAWSGVDLYAPQIYWAGGGTGAARLAAHRSSWGHAVSIGWLRAGPIAPYLQCHGCTVRDLCMVADQFDGASFWCSSEIDDDGIRAMSALVEIDLRGFRGPGRVAAFQASAGLVADGIVGARTLAALGIT